MICDPPPRRLRPGGGFGQAERPAVVEGGHPLAAPSQIRQDRGSAYGLRPHHPVESG